MLIKLTDAVLDVNEGLEYVRHPTCGAVSMFEGNIRNENDGEEVVNLEYEVYENLFQNEIKRMAGEVNDRWKIHEIAVLQRTGLLQIGDTGIIICVSSGHRREALDALSYMIEEFKKRAPVWKKERTTGNEKWINWTPQI